MNKFDSLFTEVYNSHKPDSTVLEEGRVVDNIKKWAAITAISIPVILGMGKMVSAFLGKQNPDDLDDEKMEQIISRVKELGGNKATYPTNNPTLDPGTLDTSPIGQPPAVLNPSTRPLDPGHKPEIKPTVPPVAATFDIGFLRYMKRVENGIKKGLKDGKWYPHLSAEGGNKTVAYGHKLKTGEDFSKGLTDEQAVALLKQDLDVARTGAREFVGADKFDKLDAPRQEMLIDFQFNLGSLAAFPKFVAALLENNKEEMNKHYERKYQHPTTKVWLPVKDRNNQFKKRYLPSK